VAVQGDYAYIGEGASLTILNISDPAAPSVMGRADLFPRLREGLLLEPVYDIFVHDAHAYIVENGRLRVFDVSLPSHPTESGSLETVGSALGVAVGPGSSPDTAYAYVADGDEGLRVIDVSAPDDPFEVGFCNTPGRAEDVALLGDYVYIADGGAGLRVIRASDSSEVGHVDTPGSAVDVAVAPGSAPGEIYAYVADEYWGLRVIDVSDPARPSEVGSNFVDVPSPRGVAVAGDHVYVAAGTGLVILDVFTPSNPTAVAADGAGVAWDVAVAEGADPGQVYAYVAHVQQAFRVVDVSTPNSPAQVGSYDPPAWGGPVAAWESPVTGDVLAFLGGDRGLAVVDATDPYEPSSLGFYETPDMVDGVEVLGGRAYLAAGDALRVLEFSDPSNLTQLGFYDTPGYAKDVVVVKKTAQLTYAYVADA
jgi:hypothetical protein